MRAALAASVEFFERARWRRVGVACVLLFQRSG